MIDLIILCIILALVLIAIIFFIGGIIVLPYFMYDSIIKGDYLKAFWGLIIILSSLIYPIYYTNKRKIFIFEDKKRDFILLWIKNSLVMFLIIIILSFIETKFNLSVVIKYISQNWSMYLLYSFISSELGTIIGFIRLYFSDRKIQKELWEKEIEHKEYLQELESQKRKQEEEDKHLQREFYKKSLSDNNKMTKYDELEKLAELLEKNIITQEEFDNKKKEILE